MSEILVGLNEQQRPGGDDERQVVAGAQPDIDSLAGDHAGQQSLFKKYPRWPEFRRVPANHNLNVGVGHIKRLVPGRGEELELPLRKDRGKTQQQVLNIGTHPAKRE